MPRDDERVNQKIIPLEQFDPGRKLKIVFILYKYPVTNITKIDIALNEINYNLKYCSDMFAPNHSKTKNKSLR